jgi:hypothetical protein
MFYKTLFLSLFSLCYSNDITINYLYYDNTYLDIKKTQLNTYNNSDNCETMCSSNQFCNGILNNKITDTCSLFQDTLLNNSINNINTLDLSYNINYDLFIKTTHHLINNDKHTIMGFVLDTHLYIGEGERNTTIYLDLNHNGNLDNDEPFQNVRNNKEFYFTDLEAGIYLVRETDLKVCKQIYPGLQGSFFEEIVGDGYIDNVLLYSYLGHPKKLNNEVVEISSNNSLNNSLNNSFTNFEYILGNNNEYYMKFTNNDSIIFSFVDESIVNKDGDDIYITTFNNNNNNNFYANISISSNNIDYIYLGKLNSSNTINSFDLNSIKYNSQVSYIKIDFYGPINLVNIYANHNSEYKPSNGFLVQVPNKFNDENNYLDIYFINDCHNYFACDMYCDLNLNSPTDYYSCIKGCNIFDDDNKCSCNEVNVEEFIDNYDSEYSDYDYSYENLDDENKIFNKNYCELGCNFGINSLIYPNYTLINGYRGGNKLDEHEDCDECYNDLLEHCNNEIECKSFSISDTYGYASDDMLNIKDINYNIIIKNEYLDDIIYSRTSTSTTSSITDTSSSITDTSSSITDTTSSITDTTLTTTDTTLTTTDTTLTTTDTTLTTTDTTLTTTDTSSSITDTTLTDTTLTTTDTSSSITDKNKNNINISTLQSSKDNDSNSESRLLLFIILVTLVLGLGLMVIYIIVYRMNKNKNYIERNRERATISFENPVYQYPPIPPNSNV